MRERKYTVRRHLRPLQLTLWKASVYSSSLYLRIKRSLAVHVSISLSILEPVQ